jgi:hypothetical protein
MENKSFGSGGALFVRDKKTAKAPDYGGDFVLEGPELEYVLAKARAGEPVKLEMSGWKRMGRNNTTFISTQVQLPYAERGGQQRPQQGGRGGYQQQGQGRGGYQQGGPVGGGQQGGYQQQPRRPMQQDLNDQIPDFGSSNRGRGNDAPPWE